MKIGLFYGTDTGNTERVAKSVKSKIDKIKGDDTIELFEIYKKEAADLARYDYLIIAMPTWYDGELQGDWEEYLPKFQTIDFTNKKIAFIGLGDQYGYASYFCDGIGVFADIAVNKGAILCGKWSTAGYEHDYSKAEKNGEFVGLCLDVDNQDDMTEERLDKWIPQVLQEFGLN